MFRDVIHPSPQIPTSVLSGPKVNQHLLNGKRAFLGYLHRRLSSTEEAEDVFQDFCLRVVRSASSVADDEKINAWLGQVLRHALIDHYRRRAVRQRTEATYAWELETLQSATEVDHGSDVCRCLRDAMAKLRPDHAEIIRRADLEQEQRCNLAANLGVTVSTLNVQLHRARSALRLELEKSCTACPNGSFFDCSC